MPNIQRKISKFISRQMAALMAPVVGRTRVVNLTKIILLAIAFIITAILIILPISGGINKNFRLTFSSVEKSDEGGIAKMVNPHLQGVDSNGQTYNISADSAFQDKKETMILKKIVGDINLENNGWMSITADEGYFNHTINSLDLRGNINIFNHDGYEFSTSEAYANLKKGTVYGNEEITGQGPLGNIRADSFYVEESGGRLMLRGNVKLVIYPSGVKK